MMIDLSRIYSAEFLDFLQQHSGDDLSRLILARSKYPDIDVALAAECIASRRKLKAKCPRWAQPDIVCPRALSAEQCSSELTAAYKSGVVAAAVLPENLCHPRHHKRGDPKGGAEAERGGFREKPLPLRIADLTGGLGVDAAAFAEHAQAVLYNEMNPDLCRAAAHNFAALGLQDRIAISNLEVTPDNISEILESFHPDVVFMDPARRSSSGSKVFKLADCTPNVLELWEPILDSGATLVLKLSPMADITQLCRELPNVSAVHVVGAEGECKELLLVLDRSRIRPAVTVVNLDADDAGFTFGMGEEAGVSVPMVSVLPAAGSVVFEPGKALMKSGAWNLFASRYGMQSFGRDAHVFLVPEGVAVPALGKCYRVMEAVEFSKGALADFGRRYPGADVVAHGLPLTSDELAKKLGSAKNAPAGPVRICGMGTASLGRVLLALEK